MNRHNRNPNQQHVNPSNCPNDGELYTKLLAAMTVEELNAALDDALENLTIDSYDPAWLDACLDEMDRRDPMPDFPDAETSYADFQKRLSQTRPKRPKKIVRPDRIWRAGLAAVLTVVCLVSGVVVARAEGVDVFGAIGHWSDDVFSFGPIKSPGAVDVPNDPDSPDTPDTPDSAAQPADDGKETEYASLQDALDAFGITEVSEPAWVPERFVFSSVTVDLWSDGKFLCMAAEYFNGTKPLLIHVKSYRDTPTVQVEKSNAPVETFTVNDTTVYLLENNKNNTAAWVTEHYECYIGGAVEKSELKKMVLSACADTQN